jgi:hypothetical protein
MIHSPVEVARIHIPRVTGNRPLRCKLLWRLLRLLIGLVGLVRCLCCSRWQTRTARDTWRRRIGLRWHVRGWRRLSHWRILAFLWLGRVHARWRFDGAFGSLSAWEAITIVPDRRRCVLGLRGRCLLLWRVGVVGLFLNRLLELRWRI